MMKMDKDFIYVALNSQQAVKLNAVWTEKHKLFKLPNTLGALKELHQMGFDVAQYYDKKRELRSHYENKKNQLNPKLTFDSRLRPYQKEDISYLKDIPHAAILNEQRTGKSPMTLKLLETEGFKQIIIVCPASLVLNWEKEVKTWTSYEAYSVKGTKKKRESLYQHFKNGCLILSYETLKADIASIKTTDFALVVDEAHRLRNYKTIQSKAVFQLGKRAKKRLALTGTPAVNHGSDIYGILHFLYPERYPGYWQFAERYFKMWSSPWGNREVGDYKRKEELQEILDLISVQRKRKDVMKWVPKKQYIQIEVEMDSKQKKAYEEMLYDFTVEDAGIDAPSPLAQLTRLRQIGLAPELLDINAPSAKEKTLLEWLDDNLMDRVIVFSSFSSYLRRLASKIDDCDVLTGDTSKEQRAQMVERFQAGERRILLANIQAAGVGLTLDQADVAIFLDRAYTPAENEQAEDRLIPTTENSNQNATIIDLVCKDSVDEHILRILKKQAKRH